MHRSKIYDIVYFGEENDILNTAHNLMYDIHDGLQLAHICLIISNYFFQDWDSKGPNFDTNFYVTDLLFSQLFVMAERCCRILISAMGYLGL
jgi:hypothetical protein